MTSGVRHRRRRVEATASQALRPELSGTVPLSGEAASRAADIAAIWPPAGARSASLIDTFDRLGLDAIAQVNSTATAPRRARAGQVIATLLSRCGIPDSGVG